MRRKMIFTTLLLGCAGAALVCFGLYSAGNAQEEKEAKAMDNSKKGEFKHLNDMQKYVTQHDGTEPPFQNEYWDNHEDGIYVDVVSGDPLFSSLDKFDSGTGWPSFTKPIETSHVKTETDTKMSLPRTEVRSAGADSHLGHVFDDGPADKGGKRFCINSSALRFVPVADLEKEGYGDFLYLFEGRQDGKKEAHK